MAGRGRPRKFTASTGKEKVSKRGPYNRRQVDPSGVTVKENKVQKAFWTDYTVAQVITFTPEELDAAIEKSMEEFVKRQFKWNKRWDFPKY